MYVIQLIPLNARITILELLTPDSEDFCDENVNNETMVEHITVPTASHVVDSEVHALVSLFTPGKRHAALALVKQIAEFYELNHSSCTQQCMLQQPVRLKPDTTQIF